MSREAHVPFYEGLGVQFPRPTHRPYSVPGSTTLMSRVALVPDSGRPSEGAICAFEYVTIAERSGPLTLWSVPANTMSYGKVYEPSSLTWAKNGVPAAQNAGDSSPFRSCRSGRFDRNSQESLLVFPVLIPPWSNRPSSRAFTETSRPFQDCARPPKSLAVVGFYATRYFVDDSLASVCAASSASAASRARAPDKRLNIP